MNAIKKLVKQVKSSKKSKSGDKENKTLQKSCKSSEEEKRQTPKREGTFVLNNNDEIVLTSASETKRSSSKERNQNKKNVTPSRNHSIRKSIRSMKEKSKAILRQKTFTKVAKPTVIKTSVKTPAAKPDTPAAKSNSSQVPQPVDVQIKPQNTSVVPRAKSNSPQVSQSADAQIKPQNTSVIPAAKSNSTQVSKPVDTQVKPQNTSVTKKTSVSVATKKSPTPPTTNKLSNSTTNHYPSTRRPTPILPKRELTTLKPKTPATVKPNTSTRPRIPIPIAKAAEMRTNNLKARTTSMSQIPTLSNKSGSLIRGSRLSLGPESKEPSPVLERRGTFVVQTLERRPRSIPVRKRV